MRAVGKEGALGGGGGDEVKLRHGIHRDKKKTTMI